MPKIPFWVFILVALLHFSAARVDIMDIDASQYAEISREMTHSHNWLEVYDRGNDYLDKPPFLFWASALSMKIFGATNFGYRLPSILFALLAIYATYRLARLLYDETTGRMAALILGTCQGLFLMTNDVRTDTILMSWVITALWMIKECETRRRWYYVLGGTLAIAGGMMTKGPIALLVPLFAFGSDWVLKRDWKKIFSGWHLLDIVLIALFLIPMSYGLYTQFDLHPEKWIDGKQGTSGLRFFYWSQSFGRITGESPWENGAGFDFLLVNMLWSFLPWIFLFLVALVLNIVTVVRQRFRLKPGQEWVSTGGFVLAYIALGMSRYQLPHYIFVVFPLAAIMVAGLLKDFFEGKYPKLYRIMKPVQTVAGALLWVGVLLILTIVFPVGLGGFLLWVLAAGLWALIVFRKGLPGKILWIGAAGMLLVNIFLTHHFYYRLLGYQVGPVAGRYLHAHTGPDDRIFAYDMKDPLNSLHFYARRVIDVRAKGTLEAGSGDYVLTMDEGLQDLKQTGKAYDLKLEGRLFKVSELTPGFLNLKTRGEATHAYYLLRLK